MANITDEQKEFFESIKNECIISATKNNILPSVVGSIAAITSNYGHSSVFILSNNLFAIPVDKNWYGACYSLDSGVSYENRESCREPGPALIKAFNDPVESIIDFVDYLMSVRRSDNGPLKYAAIADDMDYKSVINKLARLGFSQEFMYTTTSYFFNTCVAIIENSGIYEWDNEVKYMSRKRNRNNKIASQVMTENDIAIASEEVNDEIDNIIAHMYRVRLDWDKPDTQIFASPNYEAAKIKALEHEGYKIYIDDDGELFEDPWIKKEEVAPVIVETTIPGVKEVIHPYQGKSIDLHDTPVYRNASDEMYFKQISGRFYFYDNTIVNGRAKITATQNMPKKNPSYILGYININQ